MGDHSSRGAAPPPHLLPLLELALKLSLFFFPPFRVLSAPPSAWSHPPDFAMVHPVDEINVNGPWKCLEFFFLQKS